MNKDSKDFLYKLLETPSPTGFEQDIQRVVRKRMERFADRIEIDLHGNLIAGINLKADRRVMLAGHCDQIGFMVRHISEQGYLYLSPLGGIDPAVVHGSKVTVVGKEGKLAGVIGKKAIHQVKPEDRANQKVDLEKIWVDIGAKDRKEAEKLVEIGDPVVFELGVTELRNDLISATGLDNRVGLFVAMEALRLCASSNLSVGLYAVSTVQEEVGLRGAQTAAYSIDPEVGIAIDVTHASDSPATEDTKNPPCKLGAGPAITRGPNTNPIVEKLLVAAAKKAKIPYQPAPSSKLLGNDANIIQVSRKGVAAASIGIPNRYMHTQVEVVHLKDLELAARLLAEFIKAIRPGTDFRPR